MENPNSEDKEEISEELPEEKLLEEISKPKKARKKRAAHEIRSETIAEGAIFLNFKVPPNHKKVKWQKEWDAMAQYGFFVTTEGCIMPYKYYRKTAEAGDSLLGHIRAAHFFFDRDPDRKSRVNQFGWPETEEVSHLCHNPDCCNPLHICIEARWRNWKRHYCGINGTCDCGSQPPCVRTYTNPEVFKQQHSLETDVSRVKEILANLKAQYNFTITPKANFVADDQKSKNRQIRNKRQKKHKEEHSKKEAKRAKKAKTQ